MADVVRLASVRRERAQFPKIRGAGREVVTDAMRSIKEPAAILIVALGATGDYAVRTVSDGRLRDVDSYGRAIALLQRDQGRCFEDE